MTADTAQKPASREAARYRFNGSGALTTDIGGVKGALASDIAGVGTEPAVFKSEVAATIANAKVWALLLYVALAAGMLGTMARGFGWL